MAGDWIKMRADLLTHPKVVRMASALKADKLRVIGGLHAVWCLFDAHSTDGNLEGYTPKTLDDHLGWPGFAAAMSKIDWLTVESESLAAPRFDEHNGQSAKRRATESQRKREARKASAPDADKKRSREEKRREDSSSLRSEEGKSPRKRGPSASSVEIPDWMPGKEWGDFVEMRRAKGSRAPFTVAAAKGIIAELTKLREVGHDPAKVLQTSVNNGWSGVFALKGANGKDAPSSNWWDGKPGILDKGIELGIPAPADEHPNTWAHFKASVWVAAGDGPWWDDTSVAYPIAVKLRAGGVDLGGLAVQAIRKEDAHA